MLERQTTCTKAIPVHIQLLSEPPLCKPQGNAPHQCTSNQRPPPQEGGTQRHASGAEQQPPAKGTPDPLTSPPIAEQTYQAADTNLNHRNSLSRPQCTHPPHRRRPPQTRTPRGAPTSQPRDETSIKPHPKGRGTPPPRQALTARRETLQRQPPATPPHAPQRPTAPPRPTAPF
ncbi:proline-rich protein 2-like [Gouania willdenowi]|uniref:proline-rich protein 2-like n=1 Tax=Gouania willdenowi TaxID=441366 RepID=UPI001056408C|nr:proline-rich protein 2-like [Gouania willdenowi]